MAAVLEVILRGRDELSGTVAKAEVGFGSLLKTGAALGVGFVGVQSAVQGAVDVFKESIGAAMAFEHQLAQIRGLTGATRADTDFLSESIHEMARAMPKSPAELGAGAYFILSSGISDAGDAAEVLEISAKASAAGLGETKVVADAVTSALNAYKMEAGEAEHITDILTTTVKLGKVEADALAGSIGRILPVAAAMGVTFEEVGANLAVMTNVGLSADEAATSLRAVLTSLLKPSQEAEQALAAMGTSSQALRDQIREKGLLSTLETLMELTGGNEAAIATIIPNVRALVNVLGTVGSQGEAYTDILGQMNSASGATEKAFGEVAETTQFKLQLAMNQLKVALEELGAEALPVVVKLAQALSWLISGIEYLAQVGKGLGLASDEAVKADTAFSAFDLTMAMLTMDAGRAKKEIDDLSGKSAELTAEEEIARQRTGELTGEVDKLVRRADDMKAAFEENKEAGGDFGVAMGDLKTDLAELETKAGEVRAALFKMFREPTQEEVEAEAALKGYQAQEAALLDALAPVTDDIKDQAKAIGDQGGDAEDAELRLRGMTDAQLEQYHRLHDDLIPETKDHTDALSTNREALGATAEATHGTALTQEELLTQSGLLGGKLDELARYTGTEKDRLIELIHYGLNPAVGGISAFKAAQDGTLTTVDSFIEKTKAAKQHILEESGSVDTLVARLGTIPSEIETKVRITPILTKTSLSIELQQIISGAQHGAYIPAGVVTPMILHGGRYGEAVLPLGPEAQVGGGAGRAVEINLHVNSKYPPSRSQLREEVRAMLPEVRRALARGE